jgi:hypothetical protein
MMSTKLLQLRGRVSTRSEASVLLRAAGDAVLVERGRPRMLLLSCPCGCGEEFPINLDPRAGPAWRLYAAKNSTVSLFPSVWRESGCRSHYIIWRNKILLFGQNEEEFETSPQPDNFAELTVAVRSRLPLAGLVPFSDIAQQIDAVPWDVLKICRDLVRAGLAREGSGKQRGSFGAPQQSGSFFNRKV